MSYPKTGASSKDLQRKTRYQLIAEIQALPGQDSFLKSTPATTASVDLTKDSLICLHQFLHTDFDKDGVFDWKIMEGSRRLSKILPQDLDWDNDGIENLYDHQPLIKNSFKKIKNIPEHLLLSTAKDSTENFLQNKIWEECGVLALNYTDSHSVDNLQDFLKVCRHSMKTLKGKNRGLLLYAFSSHTYTNPASASFYPELNAMSIRGTSYEKEYGAGKDSVARTIAHELGHFFIFNFMTPAELKFAACEFGLWTNKNQTSTSFFDSFFLQTPKSTDKGYAPSDYARTNVHEWFSEVFAEFLIKRIGLEDSPTQTSTLPARFDSWIANKLTH